ncbi:MAG: ArsR/SmtB family transcription factor [Candidatus Hodarchaeales archaeon]|jgi:hypothetical protein
MPDSNNSEQNNEIDRLKKELHEMKESQRQMLEHIKKMREQEQSTYDWSLPPKPRPPMAPLPPRRPGNHAVPHPPMAPFPPQPPSSTELDDDYDFDFDFEYDYKDDIAKLREERKRIRTRERKLQSLSRRRQRDLIKKRRRVAKEVKKASTNLNNLEVVLSDFVTSLVKSLATSIGHASLDVVGNDKNKRESLLKKFWKDLGKEQVPEEYLEIFATKMATVMSAAGDENRIKILKGLEIESALYTNKIQDLTGLKGGQLKYHLDLLKEQNLIVQEHFRGRYVITQFGRAMLKFLEVLFLRFVNIQNSAEKSSSNIDSNDELNVEIENKDQDLDEELEEEVDN